MRKVSGLAVDCMMSSLMADSRLASMGKSSAAVGSRWVSPGDRCTGGRGGGAGWAAAHFWGPLGGVGLVGPAWARAVEAVYGLMMVEVLCLVRWLRPAAELKRQRREMEQVAQMVL